MVRAEYPELIEFVKNGGNIQQWSYALSAPTLFNHMIISAPLLLQKIKDENGIQIIHSFIHTSGIWLVGTKPNALNPHMIGHMSQAIFDELQHDRFKNSTNREPASNYFGSNAFIPDKRIAIGPLNFYWAKAEIEGKPSDKYLYILTKCSLCGQTNPTGFSLSRDVLHDENIHGGYASSTPNTWNNYIREDLMKFGYEIEKWDKESVLRYLKQGISLSQKNDVKKMQIYDCKVKCISCGHLINYSAENCYI